MLLILEYINQISKNPTLKQFKNIKNEIIWYLECKSNITKKEIYLDKKPISNNIVSLIDWFIKQKLKNIPFQYIIKKSSFFGRDFIVDYRALVPRIETESLFYELKKYEQVDNALEIGVGSGVICCTLSLEKIAKKILGTDISKPSIDLTKENIKNLSIRNVKIKKHDFLTAKFNQKFDLIISNPPYINLEDYYKLPIHIKHFEPQIALTDGADGLTFYHRFSIVLKDILNQSGRFYCEIGKKNSLQKIKNIFSKKGYVVSCINDLNNDVRFLKIMH
tara:strand:+ start:6199 stop:7029 length:831 start_codon:yes stop_codon:yes gene_type:complete